MRMTRRPSIRHTPHVLAVFVACAAMWAGGAVAQDTGAKSQAQRLDWPRTFSGQPDFAFTREEAITEARAAALRANMAMPSPATLMDVFSDDSILDPLQLTVVSATGVLVSGTDAEEGVSGTVPTATLMQRLMASALGLPVVSDTLPADVSEFKFGLMSTLSSTLQRWQPTLTPGTDGKTYAGVLDMLTVQAIVTSPVKYAVINQQRYAEGESFLLQMPMQVPDKDIMAALNNRMPPSGTVPLATMAEFQQAYDSVLAGFFAARKQSDSLGRKILTVPVLVKEIQPRKILLSVKGEEHELEVKFVY